MQEARLTSAMDPRGLVLFVEDDRPVADSTALLLKSAGYRVVTAEDGDVALAWMHDSDLRPDVLLVDFNLPGTMDGTEVAEAVCREMGYCVPTIILSGNLPNAEVPWMPGVPVLPMAKPVDPDLLCKAVQTFIDFGRFASLRRRRAPTTPLCADRL